MNRFYLALVSLFLCLCAYAQAGDEDRCYYVDADALTVCGQFFTFNQYPFQRVDTTAFKGFTTYENVLVRQSAGLSVAFRTNSPYIRVKASFGTIQYRVNVTGIASKGFDLYIKDGKKWLWAGSGAGKDKKENEPLTLVRDMDGSMHECLLYLPLFAEVLDLEIGVEPGSVIEAVPSPFRHRVAIFGSSFTHGASVTRSGMSYPNIFTRRTGIQLLNLGVSGNCKLQDAFADVLCAADAEAFIFDAFSNPSANEIRTRLLPFIEKVRAAHPGKPLIFQSTIYRERRNFNTALDANQAERAHVADSLMKIAVKRYPDVYYIHPNATDKLHETTVDGTHPGDHGHELWESSIEKRVLRILRKYGIR